MGFFELIFSEWDWNIFWNAISGIGTVSAVIVSLFFSFNGSKAKLKFIVYIRRIKIDIQDGVEGYAVDQEISITPYNPTSMPISVRLEGIRNKPNFFENIKLIKEKIIKKDWKYVKTFPISVRDFLNSKIEFEYIQPHTLGKELTVEIKYLNKVIDLNLNKEKPIQFVYREITGKLFYFTVYDKNI